MELTLSTAEPQVTWPQGPASSHSKGHSSLCKGFLLKAAPRFPLSFLLSRAMIKIFNNGHSE